MKKEIRHNLSTLFTRKWHKDNSSRHITGYQAHDCLFEARIRIVGIMAILFVTSAWFTTWFIGFRAEHQIMNYAFWFLWANTSLLIWGTMVFKRKKKIGNLGLKLASDWTHTLRRLKALEVGKGCKTVTDPKSLVNARLHELGKEVTEFENKKLPRLRTNSKKKFSELEKIAKEDLGLQLEPRYRYFPVESKEWNEEKEADEQAYQNLENEGSVFFRKSI